MNQQYAYEGYEEACPDWGYGAPPCVAPYRYPYPPMQDYSMKNAGNSDFNKGLVSGVGISAGIAALLWLLSKRGV
jgi:hypothetical protein